ncbi:hypothetical protein [Halorarius litoreus]|uniref:hypothetical protein n=1 Tax=Halorarius litoreus TaxID=2962676 RepID=UPI0020CC27D3|nr:hypothetical protein [Halorarius litoreus]
MRSILSTGEQRVADLLAEGHDLEQIAERRGQSVEATEKAVDRVREKTHRAFATLLASPFAAEAAADLSADERERLRAALDDH